MTTSKAIILCVDDDPDLLDINSNILQQAGYEVLKASTGNKCLRMTREKRPDLVLLDVILPDIDGYDVCRQIKDTPELAGTYVIMISGMETSSEKQIKGLEAGADGYVARPISSQELLARVQAMIRIKQMETALRKSMERYQTLVETMNEGVGIIDENSFVTFVNEKTCEIIGYPRDEIIGRPVTDFLDVISRKVFIERMAKEKRGISVPFELTCNNKDGHKIYVNISSKPIIEEGGNYRGGFAVITDITARKQAEARIKKLNEELEKRVVGRTKQLQAVIEELENEIIDRKRAEEALKKSEEQFRAIFNAAHDSIFIKDYSRRYLRTNPSMEQLFNMPASELIGKTDEELFGEQVGKHTREVDKRVLKGEIIEEEHTRPVKDDFRTFHVVKAPMRDDAGKIVGICGIARDITERKLDEVTLMRYAERLRSLFNRFFEIQKAEGRDIAQGLHDEIGQALTGIKLAVDMMKKSRSNDI
jgi:PAS domain S-box-containing protein